MLGKIVEHRRRPVGVVGIKAYAAFSRVIWAIFGLLGFGFVFVFAHGDIANKDDYN